MTLQEFADQFSNFIKNNGNNPQNWYTGIASDIQTRLFEDHNVDKLMDVYFVDDAKTEENARAVEKYLIDTFGTKGGTGGGDSTTTWVYTYKITQNTVE